MVAIFTLLESQIEAPSEMPREGKLVLSRLGAGESIIAAPVPSLKMVLEGEEVYEADGRTIRVGPGQFMYLDAGEQCRALNRSLAIGLCLFLPPAEAGEAGSYASGDDPLLGRALLLSSQASTLGRMLDQFGRMLAARPHLGPSLAPMLVGLARDTIEQPLAECRTAIAAINAAKLSTRRELHAKLETARAHLHACPHRHVPLAELAKVAGLSQFHLARFFRDAFGIAPIAYHRALRLERAAETLRRGEASVTEAAEAAGYSDPSALSHAFRRHYGRSPRALAGVRADAA